MTAKDQWYHCPGILNPADLPSRGTTGEELVQNTMWWNSPVFFQLSQDKWPQSEISPHMDQVIQSELVKNPPAVSYAFSIISVNAVYLLKSIIDCTHFSNITCLLRVTTVVLRFINKPQKGRPISNKQCNFKKNFASSIEH